MIDDIIYEPIPFIMEIEIGESGGNIIAFIMDSNSFDIKPLETSSVFIL